MKIVLIAPYQGMVHEALEVCRAYGEQVEILTGRMGQGVELARKSVLEDAGVLISRGGTFLSIAEEIAIPAVEVAVTPYDVLRALLKARDLGTKFAIVGFENVIGSVKEWSALLNVPVFPVVIEQTDTGKEIAAKVQEVIHQEQVDCILGDASVIDIVQDMGIRGVLIESGKASIWAAIQEAKRILLARVAQCDAHATFRGRFDQAAQGLMRQKKSPDGHEAVHTFADLWGQSSRMQRLKQTAKQFALTDSSVLIVGETGTGKEVIAQSIHNGSSRSNAPFVAVNCAALPEQLLESELFGYEDGAFTGARRGGKAGLFEQADGGTIFLDEIGEAPLHVQRRLLRVLEERRVMRIGGEHVIPIDVRVIAATNKPLWSSVTEGAFRQDLFFRLDVLRINTVALRDIPEDIPVIFEGLLQQIWYQRKGVGTPPRTIPDINCMLRAYSWPGNVRELRNMVEYLIATLTTSVVNREAVADWFDNRSLACSHEYATSAKCEGHQTQRRYAGSLAKVQRQLIVDTLHECQGDVQRTADMLGISRTTLWRKMKQWNLG